jgi:enamine deaminase RidA (YjgF/YER057c/UK114 family)
VLDSAGGKPQDVVAMTIFVTSRRQYLGARRAIGAAWRARFGRHYPAMTLVEVKSLLHPKALVEIQAWGVLP